MCGPHSGEELVLHRAFIIAALCLALPATAVPQQQDTAPQDQPPPSPFREREDPYFPKATSPQRFPIVNQPAPLPKLTNLDEEPADRPPPGFREPVFRLPAVDPPSDALGQGGPGELGDRFRPGEIVARVGDEVVLYGEVAWLIDQDLVAVRDKLKTPTDIEQFNKYREQRIRNVTKQLAEKKIQYIEFRRNIASQAKDKLPEAEKDLNKNVQNAFDKGLEETRQKLEKATREEMTELMASDIVLPRLALLMKEHNLETKAQLDEHLRTFGSSLDKQLAMFREHHLGQQAVIKKIGKPQELTHGELSDYYHKHADKFAILAKARFELLSVYFSRVEGRSTEEKRRAAWDKLGEMGNAVYFGSPFAEIAKKFSHETNASLGGQYDWLSKGSLASEVIDEAVFSLPINRLSRRLEDERGFHIVRVLERQEARQIPFEEAQKEIKEAINKERRSAKFKEVLESLKKGTTIWTIYDEEDAAAKEKAAQAAAEGAAAER
jgi:hypothetical protein